VNDCATCSRHHTALNVERADLLRAATAINNGTLDPEVKPWFVRRVLAAREALEAHQQDCEATA
jgi:hypothetical protein